MKIQNIYFEFNKFPWVKQLKILPNIEKRKYKGCNIGHKTFFQKGECFNKEYVMICLFLIVHYN